MPRHPSLGQRTYLEHLDTLQIDAGSLVADSRGTIARLRSARPPAKLPTLRLGGVAPEFLLGEQVGGGGMGDVLAASQVPLERRVAVKTPRADPIARAALLDEALVTGALEHPNVVPVHALGQDDAGEPLMVMRYIEGTPWSEGLEPLFDRTMHAHDEEGDPVDEQLRIFVQVCNAVSYAHSVGVLHRDLKPGNVMLGLFGEVYLLDWGLAVALHDDAPGALPLAREVDGVVGTPGYMAPEMAAADGPSLGVRSDVYLLGAVLHELVTGEPPHDGDTLIATLESAFAAKPPELPDSVPRELGDIIRRALSFDPDDRQASAEALRDGVLAFLGHRSADAVARDALARVAHLRAEIADHDAAVDEERIHELAAEARFGFRQALRDWPTSPEAHSGLGELVEVMFAWHLARGDIGAAASTLRDLPEPRDDLRERLDAALAERAQADEAREQELKALRLIAKDTSTMLTGPHATLVAVTTAVALLLPVTVLAVLRLVYGRRAGYPEAVGVAAFFAVGLASIQLGLAKEISPAGRRLRRWYVVALVVDVGVLCSGWYVGVPLTSSLASIILVMIAMLATVGVFVNRRLFSATIPLLIALLALHLAPTYRGLWLALGFGGAFVMGFRVWDPTDLPTDLPTKLP